MTPHVSTRSAPRLAALLILSVFGCDPPFPELDPWDAAPDVAPPADADVDADAEDMADADVLDVPAPMDASPDGTAAEEPPDAPPPDAGPPDVAPDDAPAVTPDAAPDLPPIDAPLPCGALSRCGDGCVDTSSAAEHCGRCGNRCVAANAAGACAAGACVFTCNVGFADCDGNSANGCETATTSTSHCGACGRACGNSNGTPGCAAGTCQIACNAGYLDCDGDNANGCETLGVNDTTHCGRCGNRCPTGQACVRGACATICPDTLCGAACVDLMTSVAHCGACGRACATANGMPRCVGATCGIATCHAGFATCDSDVANGCEVNVQTDTGNCGFCGNRCNLLNATSTCVAGACALGACVSGFGNCDGVAANGCEVNTLADLRNCGACGRTCAMGATCIGGACVCPSGHTDCGGVCRPTGGRCSVGVGACLRDGVTVCAPGGTACSATPGAPSRELCNGVDDDCDGTVDEVDCIWHLPYGQRSWVVHPLDALAARDPTRRSTHAPREPIRAAFDIESLRELYVLTATRWHRLDLDTTRWSLPDGQWRDSGALTSAFQESDATAQAYWRSPILHAFSIPAAHGGDASTHEGVEVVTRDGVIFYSFELSTREFSPAFSSPGDRHTVPPVSWEGPWAPSYQDLRSSWIDLHNRNGWVHGQPARICNDPMITAPDVTVHQMLLTATTAHPLEAGHCFRCFGALAIGDFPPFGYPGAPPLAMIGDGAFNNDSLWIFRAP